MLPRRSASFMARAVSSATFQTPFQVYSQDLIEIRLCLLEQRFCNVDAGIVDDDIEWPMRGDEFANRCAIGDVEIGRAGRSASFGDLIHERIQRGKAPRGGYDFGAAFGQSLRKVSAEAFAGCAGYERALTAEICRKTHACSVGLVGWDY